MAKNDLSTPQAADKEAAAQAANEEVAAQAAGEGAAAQAAQAAKERAATQAGQQALDKQLVDISAGCAEEVEQVEAMAAEIRRLSPLLAQDPAKLEALVEKHGLQ